MTRVINIKHAPNGWETDPQYVYIGRKGKGFDGYFGNPIARGRICPECGEIHAFPASTLDCFRQYAGNRFVSDAEYRQAVNDLKGKTLVCFCAPKKGLTSADRCVCHGQILAQLAEVA